MPKQTASRIEQYYTKIVAAFLGISVLLVAVIVFFSFSDTTVTVTAAPVEDTVTVDATLSELNGLLVLADVAGETTSTNVESDDARPGKATGRVTIYNNYSTDQPLVETTRLLSASGVLFRTQETVTAPAGGSVEVGIIADEEGASGDIGPSRFEIVALWDGLKEQIYAESTTSTSGGLNSVGVVTQNGIANAVLEVRTTLADEAISAASESVASLSGLPDNAVLLQTAGLLDGGVVEPSVAAGSEATSFTVSVRGTAAVPVVDQAQLETVLEQSIATAVPDNRSVVSVGTLDQIEITVTDIDSIANTANLEFEVPISYTITAADPLLDTADLTNKSEGEIRNYLTGFDEIANVSVQFSPRWKTTTPALADTIRVVVE